MIAETAQIGIVGVQDRCRFLVGKFYITDEVHGSPIPLCLFVHGLPEEGIAEQGLHGVPHDPYRPGARLSFRSRLVTRIDLLTALRILRTLIDLLQRVDLGLGLAFRILGSLAQQDRKDRTDIGEDPG